MMPPMPSVLAYLRAVVSRLVALAGAAVIVLSAAPAVASNAIVVSVAAPACGAGASGANAVRAVLTPMTTIEEDVAFNRDDPDAERSPLELIRFPDESALWQSTGITINEQVIAGDGTRNARQAFAFSGPDRQDREVSDSIVRLYCGLFGRAPDPFELEYWASRYWNGLPLVTIAEAFTHADEFIANHGVLTNTELVEMLYTEVLGREPGIGGVTPIVDRLAAGEIHVGQAIVQFTESGEFVRATGTVTPSKPPLPYPDVGSGRRIIMSESIQRVWLIEASGELYNTHQVSGRRGIPGVGRYRVYSKSRYAWAPHDGITMEFMVRFARGEWPYGFHSIPVYPGDDPLQTPAQLGTHRSGGCVRQLWDDAAVVFGWAEIGDRVLLIP